MLLREKVIVLILIAIAYVLVCDQITPWGNRLWEAYTGNTARYAVMQKSKLGYINGRGRLVIPTIYEEGDLYSNQGPILVKNGKNWGFINHNGEAIISSRYFSAKDFSNSLAAVSMKEPRKFFSTYGFIDNKEVEVIALKYDNAKSFADNGLAAVKKDSQWGYLNTYGNWVIKAIYDEANDFHQDRAAVKNNGQWGYVDFSGSMVIDPQFEEAGDFSQGIAPVKQKGLWGYIDLQGRWVTEPSYTEAHALSEGLGLVKGYNSVGFVDKYGHVVFHTSKWIDARDFSDGAAAVKLGQKQNNPYVGTWGYINTKGRFFITPQFDWAWNFNGGLARVGLEKNDIRRGYVNKDGRMMWDPADWQQSAYTRCKIYIAIVFVILVYLFYSIRYVKWHRQFKKDEAIKKATAVSQRPSL